MTVEIDLTDVNDWDSFHAAFERALGFPGFYGRNMNAWEDVMSDLSKPGLHGMTELEVPRGVDLVLLLKSVTEFRQRRPEIFEALLDSTTHVNRQKAPFTDATRLLLRLE
ncbi:MAG: barstar family protein [Chloroflexi bacterium]|nr:barstar family protein [Chloroflexota bacterium]